MCFTLSTDSVRNISSQNRIKTLDKIQHLFNKKMKNRGNILVQGIHKTSQIISNGDNFL